MAFNAATKRKDLFGSLKRMTVGQRINAVRETSPGSTAFSLLTPAEFAELFPKYYQKGLPDVGGFREAISKKSAQRQEDIMSGLAENQGITVDRAEKIGRTKRLSEGTPDVMDRPESTSRSSPGKTVAKGDLAKNQREAYKAARAEGLSDSAARILVANMSGESLADPTNRHWDRKHFSQGIVQWDDDRSERIKKQFGAYPKDMSVAEQTKAAIWEMKEHYKPSWNALNDEKLSPEERLGTVVRDYERPQDGNAATAQRMRHFNGLPQDFSREEPTATVSGFTQEQQSLRPSVRHGNITFEGDDRSSFHYGSGSPTDPNYPSIPFGSSNITKLNPHNVPGGAGYDLPSLQGYDPKVNRQRDGMVIHMGRTNDPNKLYSHGCLAIPPDEFPEFQKRLEKFRQENGNAYINVFPDGHISVTSKPAFSGKDGVLTADAAMEKQKESIVNNQKPIFNNPVSQKLQTDYKKGDQGSESYDQIVTNRENSVANKPEQVAPSKVETENVTTVGGKVEKQKPAEAQRSAPVAPAPTSEKPAGPRTFNLNRQALVESIKQTSDYKKETANIPSFLISDDAIADGFFKDARTKKIMKDTGTTYDPATGRITSENPDKLLKSFGDMDTTNVLTPDKSAAVEAVKTTQTASVMQREFGVASAQAQELDMTNPDVQRRIQEDRAKKMQEQTQTTKAPETPATTAPAPASTPTSTPAPKVAEPAKPATPAPQAPQAGKPDESSTKNFLRSQGIPGASDGGSFNVGDRNIGFYPMDKKDNLAAVDTVTQQPLFTAKTGENISVDPTQNTIDVTPQQKVSGAIPPGTQMNEMKNVVDTMFDMASTMGKSSDINPPTIDRSEAKQNQVTIDPFLNQKTTGFPTSSLERAMSKARGRESDYSANRVGSGTSLA